MSRHASEQLREVFNTLISASAWRCSLLYLQGMRVQFLRQDSSSASCSAAAKRVCDLSIYVDHAKDIQ